MSPQAIQNAPICAACPERGLCRRMLADDFECPKWVGLAELATRAVQEVWRAGTAQASPEVLAAREAACAACRDSGGLPLWDAKGNLGLGRCLAPGCGCTRFKRRLRGAKCVLNRWPK